MVSAAQSNVLAAAMMPAQIDTQASYAVMGKVLDSERQEGAQIVSMIDAATGQGGQGGLQAGDPLVAKATGLGGMLDTFA